MAFITSGAAAVSGASLTARRAFTGAAVCPVSAGPAVPVAATWSMSAGGLRTFLVGGNWKCNLSKDAITSLCKELAAAPDLESDKVEVVLAPPTPYLDHTRSVLRRDFEVAAQNIWVGGPGAFTGETAAEMIKDVGCTWVILGHSERRNLPQIRETDDFIAQKTKTALSHGLKVMFCIGETLEEREDGRTLDVCVRQLGALAQTIEADDWKGVVIAYEPVWAIGTGKIATPDQVEEVHEKIRHYLAGEVNEKVAEETRILYGGSVSPGNCNELAQLPDVDGFLVGGASLKASFLDVIESFKSDLAATV